MRKHLKKDCVTFLAHIVHKGANVKNIQNIPIERNHTEVFLKDLFGLPPTKIWIDLVLGAAPVKVDYSSDQEQDGKGKSTTQALKGHSDKREAHVAGVKAQKNVRFYSTITHATNTNVTTTDCQLGNP
ncbi:hypothetical protein Tco_1496979, partial [Tanacetum coccineum]